jgi:NAD(P)-dependent dehydrogenase (short-subunit alcohol dehydrogenase family)
MMAKIYEGKIALVTGASRGIGYAVAKHLAAHGAHVIVVSRTIGALEALDDEIQAAGGSCTIVAFDLMDGDKIDQLGGVIAERFGKLDILVGNAGLLSDLAPVAHVDPKIWNKIIAVNLTANYRLIRSFDPLLRQAEAGRAVFMSSSSASEVVPYWGAYAASKAGLESLVKHYAAEVATTAMKVNMIDPGAVDTMMLKQAYPGADLSDRTQPDDVNLLKSFIDLTSDSCKVNGEVVRIG